MLIASISTVVVSRIQAAEPTRRSAGLEGDVDIKAACACAAGSLWAAGLRRSVAEHRESARERRHIIRPLRGCRGRGAPGTPGGLEIQAHLPGAGRGPEQRGVQRRAVAGLKTVLAAGQA